MSKKEQSTGDYKQVVDVYPQRGVIEIQNPSESNRENQKMFTYDAVYDSAYNIQIYRTVIPSYSNNQTNICHFSAQLSRIFTMKSYDRLSHPCWKVSIAVCLPTVKLVPVKHLQWKAFEPTNI